MTPEHDGGHESVGLRAQSFKIAGGFALAAVGLGGAYRYLQRPEQSHMNGRNVLAGVAGAIGVAATLISGKHLIDGIRPH